MVNNRTRVLNRGERKLKLIFSIAVICFVVAISIAKYRSDEVNYLNADATWHTLLTIQAYDETPVSSHLFLPIVSLGEDLDKNIPWGATVSDSKGNYYYTSFSPAAYFAPWLFFKTFRLAVCEKSLYIFNTLLLSISAVMWGLFIWRIYDDKKYRLLISMVGVLSYVLTPEILHGMGIVYWSQSIMQVTLLAQIMAYYEMKRTNSKSARICFYTLALINPYVEWTGYVANIGFAICELITDHKLLKKSFINVCKLGTITVASFGLFCCHYLCRLETSIFFQTLKNRFMARNVTTTVELTEVFGGFYKSLLYIWVLFVVLIIWNIAMKKNIEVRYGTLMLIMAFPVIENIIMKQHALSYSYDRMKAGFLMSFMICDLSVQLWEYYKYKRLIVGSILTLTLLMGLLNIKSYKNDESYIWNTNYRQDNEIIAAYINDNYSDSVLGLDGYSVRGYINLLFGRGIYEWRDADYIVSTANEMEKKYGVMLSVEDAGAWNVYDLSGATVYDCINGDIRKITVNDGAIIDEVQVNENGYQLSELTDENWTNGYSSTNNTLLFDYNTNLLFELKSGKFIRCSDKIFNITDFNYDTQWITVSVDGDASACMYPEIVFIEK